MSYYGVPRTATDPAASRLSDGTSFYKATTPSDTQPVSASSLPLPTGASSLAEQQTQTTHLATIAGDTTDIEAAVELIDDTVATTAAAIPTKGLAISGTDGTNARIVKTDSSGELQVDVVSVVPGTGATNLGKAEDAAHTTGDTGVMPLAVQNETAATFSATPGDYVPIGADRFGSVYVSPINNAGEWGHLYEDDPHTSADIGRQILAVRKATPANLSDTDGDYEPLQVSAGRLWTSATIDAALPSGDNTVGRVKITDGTDTALVTAAGEQNVIATAQPGVDIGDVTINNASGASAVNIQDGGNTITVDGTITANLSATDNTVLDNIDADTSAIQTAVELIDDTVATLGTTTYTEAATKGLTIGAVRRDADTTLVNTTNEIGPLQMDANGRLKVEAFSGETLPVSLTSTTVTGTVAVTQSGTWDEVGINDSGNSITVDNGGTFAVQDSQVVTDNAAFTDGTTRLFMAGHIFDETAGTALTENDAAAPRINANRSTVASIEDGTTRARYATVKAASTAAAFTDTALVVDCRPGGALVSASAALADALANPTLGQQAVLSSVFNGSTWDRQRGMSVATTTGDSGAKTATGNGATQTNVGNKGVQIFIDLGTVSGTTPTCVFKVQGSVNGGTNWFDLPGATTATLTSSVDVGIMIYPGVVATAGTTTTGTTATVSLAIPRTWRMVWTIGGTTPSFTITSITYNYLPN